jgi:hypothetical protein
MVFAARFKAENKQKRELEMAGSDYLAKRTQKGVRQQVWCSVKDCERPKGHTSENCFSFGGGKQGQYAPWWNGPKDIHLPKSQRATRRAKTNAFLTNVRVTDVPDTMPNNDMPLGTSNAQTSLQPIVCEEDPEATRALSEPVVWMNHLPAGTLDNDNAEQLICAIPITSDKIDRSDDCYHDSAANRHVFQRKDVFTNYQDITPVKIHGFSQGLETAALGTGDITLSTSHHGTTKTITLTKCIYVPGAHANLISQARLDKAGVSTWFEKGKVTIYKDSITYITGELKNKMYRLDIQPTVRTTSGMDDGCVIFATKQLTRPSEGTPSFYTA